MCLLRGAARTSEGDHLLVDLGLPEEVVEHQLLLTLLTLDLAHQLRVLHQSFRVVFHQVRVPLACFRELLLELPDLGLPLLGGSLRFCELRLEFTHLPLQSAELLLQELLLRSRVVFLLPTLAPRAAADIDLLWLLLRCLLGHLLDEGILAAHAVAPREHRIVRRGAGSNRRW